jgi:hypothetical protein
MYIRYLHNIFTLSVFDIVQGCIYNIYKAYLATACTVFEAVVVLCWVSGMQQETGIRI